MGARSASRHGRGAKKRKGKGSLCPRHDLLTLAGSCQQCWLTDSIGSPVERGVRTESQRSSFHESSGKILGTAEAEARKHSQAGVEGSPPPFPPQHGSGVWQAL